MSEMQAVSSFPCVFILLLNYRGTDDTLACLDSLKALKYPHFQIIVVDNASPDNSVERLQARLEAHPGEFALIPSGVNGGFSAGNNLGIEAALNAANDKVDAYVWLLNNDTTVTPDTLGVLVQEAQKTGGVAGSLLLYPDGTYQQTGTRFNWWTGSSKGYKEREIQDGMCVEALIGASMMIPFSVFQKIGLWDPSFFLYFEDGEFSLRCARAGFPLTVSLKSIVYHKEGATTGRKSLPTQYYYHRNRLRMLFMYANPLQKISIAAYTVYRMLRTVVKSLLSSDAERSVSMKVQWLALQDFCRGVSGPCPHNLESLR